jgi:hypothetical protein
VNTKRILPALLLTIALAAAPAAGVTPDGAAVTPEDFKLMVGEWEGHLEYLDYSDNKTRVRLAVTLACVEAEGGIAYAFTYTEPNGRKVAGDRNALSVSAGRVRINGDDWAVSRREGGGRPLTLVLTREGRDDDKPATLRRTLTLSAGELRISNEARAAGAADFVLRNEYELKRRAGGGAPPAK